MRLFGPIAALGRAGARIVSGTIEGTFALIRGVWARQGILTLGVCLTILLIHRRIYEYLLEDPRTQVDLSSLQVAQRPGWASEGLDFEPLRAPQGRMSLLDPKLVDVVADYYRQNPWIESVAAVDKFYPNRVQVRVCLRRPVAAIPVEGGLALVDDSGVRLPGLYPRVPETLGALPTIVGISGEAPPPGVVWSDPGVNEALTVARALRAWTVDRACPIAVIDVRNLHGGVDARQTEIVLWTPDQRAIHWGRASDTMMYGELPVAEKMANLRRVLAVHPRLAGLKSVKLHFREPYIEPVPARVSEAPPSRRRRTR